jgi:hypothetical protein
MDGSATRKTTPKSKQQEKIIALQLANLLKPPETVEKVFLNTLASKEMFRRVPLA